MMGRHNMLLNDLADAGVIIIDNGEGGATPMDIKAEGISIGSFVAFRSPESNTANIVIAHSEDICAENKAPILLKPGDEWKMEMKVGAFDWFALGDDQDLIYSLYKTSLI